MILSKHKILNEEYVFFKDRIPKAQEYFGRRGALAAKIKVTKVVAGAPQFMEITAINTQLATWYSEGESLWSNVREKQADDVIAMVAAHKDESELVVVAGDLNSTPESPVFKKFLRAGLVDTLLDLEGKHEDATSSVTWGHANNTWTAREPGARLNYVLFTHAGGKVVRTSAYHTVGPGPLRRAERSACLTTCG
jgi:endonuclease/exonuclease/phosphatase family metal-dependent hydrolase